MSKSVAAFLGIVVGAVFIYFCVETKKDSIALKCHVAQNAKKVAGTHEESADRTIEEVPAAARTAAAAEATTEVAPTALKEAAIFEKSDPAFGITVEEPVNVVGMFAPEAKEGPLMHFIDELCSQKECLDDLRYSKDIKHESWDQAMIRLIQFMTQEHIEKGSIYVNSNILHIEGVLENAEQRTKLDEIIKALKEQGLSVEDKTQGVAPVKEAATMTAAPQATPKPAPEPAPESKHAVTEAVTPKRAVTPAPAEEEAITEVPATATPDQKKVPSSRPAQKEPKPVTAEKPAATHAAVEQQTASNDLSALTAALQNGFDDRQNRLNAEGSKAVVQIAGTLRSSGAKKVRIKVYVHQGDDALVNMIIAQKRATILKNTLQREGVTVTEATGESASDGAEQIVIETIN